MGMAAVEDGNSLLSNSCGFVDVSNEAGRLECGCVCLEKGGPRQGVCV